MANEDEPPAPRRPGWGCLIAAVVAGIGLIVVAVLAAGLLNTAFEDVKIR
jgi:hypothetical protein